MISILIPTYNYNISTLIHELHKQATESYVDFEILVVEDGSKHYIVENRKSCQLANCNYEILSKNIGRSVIRNYLADKARYEHLLFLDCDAEVNSPHFIEKYLAFCHEECVVVGGTAYDPLETNPAYSLRLKYGREREATLASKREIKGRYAHFSTFNFLISKSIFQQIRFDETIRGYGHEDTLFGYRIAELNYPIHHIDNPLLHKGLESNTVFLQKTEEGTRNLYYLNQLEKYHFLTHQSKLLRTFAKCKKYHLTRFLSYTYRFFNKCITKKLSKSNPSLLLYDFYKLIILSDADR